jgi:endonuclease-3
MARESKASRTERTKKIIAILRKRYPHARTALEYSTPLELLIATILSAQCTDKRVNMVTPELFKKYRTARAFADAPPGELEEQIKSTGFYRNKAKSIRGASRKIVDEFGGKVPDEMDDLLALPGVARKTANVVLGDAFGKSVGVVVDTHVIRLAGRLGLTSHANNQGDRIEKDLMELVPRAQWTVFSHLLIFHGRAICTARKPRCDACPVNKLCPSAFKV